MGELNPLLAMLVMFVFSGCSSFQRTTGSDESTDSHKASVEVGEPEIEVPTLPNGCVETIEELPSSHAYKRDSPELQGNHLIVVLKQARRLMLFQDAKLRHDRAGGAPDCWRLALGVYKDGRPSGNFDKLVEGDRHTPIGLFRVSDKPWSQYHGAILVHYPSPLHAQQAHSKGRINQETLNRIARAHRNGTVPPQNTILGGDILIHGGGSSADWTWGCIALNDRDLDELRSLLPKGMKTWILILP